MVRRFTKVRTFPVPPYRESRRPRQIHRQNPAEGNQPEPPSPKPSLPGADTLSDLAGSKWFHWFKRPKNLIQLLTLLFVGAYTCVTYNLFFTGYRAIIYFDNATFATSDKQVPPESNGKVVLFNGPWVTRRVISANFLLTNAGNTPTRDMRVILDCRPVGYADLLHHDPFHFLKSDSNVAHPEIVGPKQTISVGPCDIDPGLISKAQMGIVPIIFSGEIRYKDRVGWLWWADHITEFSQELVIESYDDKTGKIEATTHSIGMHNCADDCPDQ